MYKLFHREQSIDGTVPLFRRKFFAIGESFLRGVEASSIFMKYWGRSVLDDLYKIAHIVVANPTAYSQ
jgi:hypothetical protein